MTGRAVVMEVENGNCTVLTDDGEFRRLKMRGAYRPGQVITMPAVQRNISRFALVAACLLLMFTVAAMWQFAMVPAVASYVSLDINPSLELALDEDNMVRAVNPLDDEGSELISGLDLRGGSLESALDQIVSAAIDKNYINQVDESIILFTVTPVGDLDPSTVDRLVKESIDAPLQMKKVKAQVVVGNVTPEIREMSQKTGISPGRYLLMKNAANRGINIKPEELKGKSIYSIEKEHKIKIQEAIEAETGGSKWEPKERRQWLPGNSPLKNRQTEADNDEDGRGNPQNRDDSGKNLTSGKKQMQTPDGKTTPPGKDNGKKAQRQAENDDDDKNDKDDQKEKREKLKRYELEVPPDWKRIFNRDRD